MLTSILTSSGFGALIGLLGSWLTKREERKSRQMQFEHDVKMAEIRKAEAEIEYQHELALADKQIERAKVEGEIAQDIAEIDAFKESLKEQQKMYKIKFVDAIRGLMRPILTIYLLILASIVAARIGGYVGGIESLGEKLLPMYQSTINQMIFLTTTAVTWWFGSRPSSQRKDK